MHVVVIVFVAAVVLIGLVGAVVVSGITVLAILEEARLILMSVFKGAARVVRTYRVGARVLRDSGDTNAQPPAPTYADAAGKAPEV